MQQQPLTWTFNLEMMRRSIYYSSISDEAGNIRDPKKPWVDPDMPHADSSLFAGMIPFSHILIFGSFVHVGLSLSVPYQHPCPKYNVFLHTA